MTTWEEKIAASERRQKAETVLYAIKQYFESKGSLDRAYAQFDGPSPGYFLSDQTNEVERYAVEAIDALESLIDERVRAALEKARG